MKMYPLRLDDEDQRRREKLVAHYSKKHGRRVDYSWILRELQREKVEEIEAASSH